MHGWISFPQAWLLTLLIVAALGGAMLGCMRQRRNAVVHWLVFSATYAVFMVLVAFCYESWRMPGHYNVAAWSILVVPALVLVLPVAGAPWILAGAITSRADSSRIAGLNRAHVVAGFAVLVGLASLAVLAPYIDYVLRPQSQPSTYRIPPIDPDRAPQDLSEITAGSDWSCVNLRDGKPASTGMDLHFAPLDGEARWQGFDHEDNKRPFFDLDHARGVDQFFAGSYRVEAAKLLLMSDEAGMSLQFESSGAMKVDAQNLRTRQDPRLRGEVLLRPNSYNGVFKTLSVRDLSTQAMSIVEAFNNNGMHAFESNCVRVRDPAFHGVPRLATDRGR